MSPNHTVERDVSLSSHQTGRVRGRNSKGNNIPQSLNIHYLGFLIGLIGAFCLSGFQVPAELLAFSEKEIEAHMARGSQFLEKELYAQAVNEFQQAARLNPKSVPAFYNLGLAYWKLRKLDLASEAFEKALSFEPSDAYSQYYMGRIHLLKGETPKAIAVFERLTGRKTPPVADEQYQLGLAYLKSGNSKKAIQWLEQARKQDPQNANVGDALGKAYQLAGRKEEAEQALKTSSQLRDQNLEASQLLHSCRQFLQSKQMDKALEIRSRLLDSGDLDYLVAVGTLFGENGQPEYAVEPLEKAVALNQQSFEAQFNLGYTYLGLQKDDLAEQHLAQAASLRPDSFEAYSLLGVARGNLKKNLPAIESFKKAAELRPDNVRVLSLLALQYIDGKFYGEATALLRRALQHDDSDPTLWFLLIQAHYKNQDSVRALELAQKTLERFPALARAHYELGFQLASMGRFQEAKGPFMKALQLDPEYPEAHYSLGDLLLKEDKPEEAISHFRQALKMNQNYGEAYASLGRALLSLKKYEEVVAEMKKAVSTDSADPQPHLYLAQAYRALGQQEDAQRELQAFDRLNRQRMKQKDQEAARTFPQP
jgi:tetratricopeptide (TPR) repeat protein